MVSRSLNPDDLVYEEDLDLLKDYQTNGRPLVDVLIEKYLESSAELVKSMEKALAASDLRAFSRAAHSLKSSSRSLGLRPLGDMVETAEHLEAFSPETEERLIELRETHAACCEILKKKLSAPKGQGAA